MEKAKQNAETSVEWEKVTGSGDIDLFKTHKTRQTVLVGPYLLFFFYSTPKILYFNFETFRWGHSAPSGNSGLMDSSSKRNPICVVDNTKIIVFGGSFHFFGKSMYLDTLTIQNKYGSSLDMAWESQDFKEKVPFRVFHTVELFNGHLYFFGGRDQNGHLTNKLIAFNLKTNSPFAVQFQGPKPCERYDHSSLLYKDKMYIFGGSVAEGVFLNDLWAWDMKYSKWESITKDKDTLLSGMPGPRCLSLMQGSGDELFIFKGNKKQEVCEDLFSYNIGSNQWKKLKLSDNIPFTSEPHTFVVYDKAFIIGKHLELYQSKLSASALEKDNDRFIKIAPKNVNETSDGILVQYKKIFEEKLFPDITFKVEGEEICAHRAILAGRSNYFKNVFTSQMMESHSKVVEISHVKAPVFKALLEFIYCDEAPITEEIAFDLFKLSDEYSLRNLRAKCELFLINHLNVSSVIDVVNHADLVEANNLRKAGLKFIGKNIEDINTIDDVTRIKKTVLVDLIKK